MGYTTEFEGVLEFTQELTIPQLQMLGQFLGADARDHPEWMQSTGSDVRYIAWEITTDYKGLKWDGACSILDFVQSSLSLSSAASPPPR